jgi:hypothetical protein
MKLRRGDISTPDFSGYTTPISSTPTANKQPSTLRDVLSFTPDSRSKVQRHTPTSAKKASTDVKSVVRARHDEDIVNTVMNFKTKGTSKPSFIAKHAKVSLHNDKVTGLTQKLTESEQHYKLLERKYRELKAKVQGNKSRGKTVGLLERPATTDLYSELRASPRSIDHSEGTAVSELLNLILQEVRDVKARVCKLEGRVLLE